MELVIFNEIRILVDLKCNLSGSQATISPPSKGHLYGVSLADHSWLNFTCLLGWKSAQSVISLLCYLCLAQKFNDLVCKNGLKSKTKGPPPRLSEASCRRADLKKLCQTLLLAGAIKMYFFVNRQAVACWRPMPSNLNSNYIQLTLTKLGTLSYNQDKPTCLATETS